MKKMKITSVTDYHDNVVVTFTLNGESFAFDFGSEARHYNVVQIQGEVFRYLESYKQLEQALQGDAPLRRVILDTSVVMTHFDEDHFISANPVEPEAPPKLAETLLQLLAPKRTVDHLVGDLQEKFSKHARQYGLARARRFYWTQVLRAVGPSLGRLVRKWSIIGILIDYGRSKIGW